MIIIDTNIGLFDVCLAGPGKKPPSNTAQKIAAAAVGVLAAPVLVIAGAALGAVGFTSTGVAVGSIAAGVQSALYGGSVAAGSVFALCQSAGATGVIGSAATAGIVATLGLFVRLKCLHIHYSNVSRRQQD